jgi:hypothetical protein
MKQLMVLPEEQAIRCLIGVPLAPHRAPQIGGTRVQMDPVDILFVECTDEALTDLLGTRAREAIYDHLERNCLIARKEIPKRLDDFFKLLNETFGQGSRTIGKVIAKKLYSKLGWKFVEVSSYEIEDYFAAAKNRLKRELAARTNRI